MKTANMGKCASILGVILILIAAILKAGGDATSIMVVLISTLIFIAASIKVRTSRRGDKAGLAAAKKDYE